MDTSRPDPPPQRERVAVVVVHGVADQGPALSVRQVANLLANVDEGGAPAYAPFTEHPVRIPVRPVPTPPGTQEGAFFLASRSTAPTPIDFTFTEAQLVHYTGEGPAATYDTVRLSSTRPTPAGDLDVDLFEMYWADLSRVGSSTWRVLGELYQVLLHVGSLGKHAASASAGPDPRLPARAFRWTTATASWMLAGPIAIFNAFIVAAAVMVLSGLLPPGVHPVLAVGIAALAVLVPTAILLLLTSKTLLAYRVGALVILVILLAAWAMSGIPGTLTLDATRVLAFELLLLALAAIMLLLRAYDARRPGSYWISGPTAGLVLIVGCLAIASAVRPENGDARFAFLVAPGFRIIEALFYALYCAWAGFIGLYWLSLLAGEIYWRRIADPTERDAAARSVWTARITLVIPAAMFLLLTVALWSGLHSSVEGSFEEPYTVSSLLAPMLPGVTTGGEFISTVLVFSVGPTFVPAAVLLTLGAVLAIVALAPIVWTEVFPPGTNALAGQYGAWLTSAFAVLKGSGRLAVAAFVVWPLLSTIEWFTDLPALLASRETAATIVGWLGLAVAVPTAGLLALRGRLSKLMAGFRAPVDVLLDVDGYLREHPRNAAPRARVFARYYSLLQQLAEARPRYRKIVVIAHSQGTVITADLFRYLQYRALWPVEDTITLFTMGSPLRQLYARRFPELYEWVWHTAPAVDALHVPDIEASRCPDPADLRVRRWVNAYRSGDYIGRWLWRPDVCGYQFETPPMRASWSSIDAPLPGHSHDPDQRRREFCIGAGAHTHYWDGTAPEIAVELDLMIRTPA